MPEQAVPKKTLNSLTPDTIEDLIAKGSLDEAAKAIQVLEGLRKLREEERARELANKARIQQLLAVQEEMEMRAAQQEACAHLKDNNMTPAVSGMKDSSGKPIYICLRCQKLWYGEELPEYLRRGIKEIGGPVSG